MPVLGVGAVNYGLSTRSVGKATGWGLMSLWTSSNEFACFTRASNVGLSCSCRVYDRRYS